MDFSEIELPPDMMEIIDVIFNKAKMHNQELTESIFLQRIFDEWLDPYRREKEHVAMSKRNSVLRNNLKQIFDIYGKSQSGVARRMGVNRAYLGQVINGRYEPSIFFVLLLMEALECPPKINDLFYLEPISQE